MPAKILIADQSETVREVAENLFRRIGFEVVSASDGVEALELVRTSGVDLALVNSGLPEIDGYAVSQQIKSEDGTRGVKVVLLISTSEIVNQHILLSSLADDTLNKPFSPQDLLEAVSTTLGVDVAGEPDSDDDAVETEVLGDDAEEIDLDGKVENEIDFGSIFGEEGAGDGRKELDGVFLHSEEIVGSSGDSAADPPDAGRTPGAHERVEDSEDTIRLSDDQYGLESPPSEPEIEPPHDYNWFVREMKKDLRQAHGDSESTGADGPALRDGKRGDSKTHSAARKAGVTSISKVQFETEEIGISKTPLTAAKPDKEEAARTDYGADESHAETAPVDLTLAEKLLVKELAREIAEKLVGRMSTAELRKIMIEALTDLKKV
jgi:CheY-like chemotaxis protein